MKRFLAFILATTLSCAAHAVPVSLSPVPHITFVNGVGAPCAGCSLFSYAAGTTSPLATYVDAGGVSTNTNPVILDAAGGANIWLGSNSYKLVLKDPLGTTIWSVDQVNAGNLFACGPAGTVQIANSAVNGLSCDSSITINTSNHTLNIGTLPANYVTIGALGPPTSWTFDTTSPATALASLGGGSVGAGTPNQLAYYVGAGTVLAGTSAIPAGITAITQAPSDNSTNPATTAYVALPGAIGPTSLALAAGTAMTANQGTGTSIQHSTGAAVANNFAKFDATGNTVDSGISAAAVVTRTCNSNGCYRVEGDGTIEQWGTTFCSSAACVITFPFSFTTTSNLSITGTIANVAGNVTTTISGFPSITNATFQSNGVINVGGSGGGYSGGGTMMWHAIGN